MVRSRCVTRTRSSSRSSAPGKTSPGPLTRSPSASARATSSGAPCPAYWTRSPVPRSSSPPAQPYSPSPGWPSWSGGAAAAKPPAGSLRVFGQIGVLIGAQQAGRVGVGIQRDLHQPARAVGVGVDQRRVVFEVGVHLRDLAVDGAVDVADGLGRLDLTTRLARGHPGARRGN